MRGEGVLGRDHVQNILLALGVTQIRIQEMLVELGRSILQLRHAKGAYGLHNIGPNAL